MRESGSFNATGEGGGWLRSGRGGSLMEREEREVGDASHAGQRAVAAMPNPIKQAACTTPGHVTPSAPLHPLQD